MKCGGVEGQGGEAAAAPSGGRKKSLQGPGPPFSPDERIWRAGEHEIQAVATAIDQQPQCQDQR